MRESELIQLTRTYQAATARLGLQYGAAIAQVFAELGSWDEADVVRFADAIVPFTYSWKRAVVQLASAHMSQMVEGPMVGVPPAQVSLAPPDPWTAFTALWHDFKSGVGFDAGISRATAVAAEAGNTWVFATARATAGEWERRQPARGPRTVGYRRVLTGSSCEWCALVATQRYRTFDSATFGHDNCDCGVVPITGTADPGRVINKDLYDNLNKFDPELSQRIDEGRRSVKLSQRAAQAEKRRDAALAEAVKEPDSARRVRLEAKAREYEKQAHELKAAAAGKAAGTSRFPRPEGSTGYVYPDGSPAPKPVPQ